MQPIPAVFGLRLGSHFLRARGYAEMIAFGPLLSRVWNRTGCGLYVFLTVFSEESARASLAAQYCKV